MCLQYLHSAWFLDGRNQYLLCMYVALIWVGGAQVNMSQVALHSRVVLTYTIALSRFNT